MMALKLKRKSRWDSKSWQKLLKYMKSEPDIMEDRATRGSICEEATKKTGILVTEYFVDKARRELGIIPQKDQE